MTKLEFLIQLMSKITKNPPDEILAQQLSGIPGLREEVGVEDAEKLNDTEFIARQTASLQGFFEGLSGAEKLAAQTMAAAQKLQSEAKKIGQNKQGLRESIAHLGRALLKSTKQNSLPLPRTIDTAKQWFDGQFRISKADTYMAMLLSLQEGQMSALSSVLWAANACPLVQFAGHRYIAALLSTQARSDAVRPPWDAFMIELPPGFFTTTFNGHADDITHVSIYTFAGDDGQLRWNFIASSKGASLHRSNVRTEDFLDPDIGERSDTPKSKMEHAFNSMNPYFAESDELDVKTLRLISRLVVNTCIAMSDPDEVKESAGCRVRRDKKNTQRKPDTEPVAHVFVVGHPVVIDCRSSVQDYLTGRVRNPSTVQWLVRGHWRNQACGPALTLRRNTWVEPHWKGPEDAPITVRPHVLKRDLNP